MGTENRALVGDALELVVVGVGPYLDRVRQDGFTDSERVDRDLVSMLDVLADAPVLEEEGQASAAAISAYARELQAVWDAWARIRPFDAAETYRALDTAARLLLATGAEDEAATVRELATVPLALFAARALADYVTLDSVDGPAPEAAGDPTAGSGDAPSTESDNPSDDRSDEAHTDATPPDADTTREPAGARAHVLG